MFEFQSDRSLLSPHRTVALLAPRSHAHVHRRTLNTGMSLSPRGLGSSHGAPCSVARLDSPCHGIAPMCLALHFSSISICSTCFSPDMSLSSLTFFLSARLSTCKQSNSRSSLLTSSSSVFDLSLPQFRNSGYWKSSTGRAFRKVL
jgi:hypothetical protein